MPPVAIFAMSSYAPNARASRGTSVPAGMLTTKV
jgi:hypothetical protein